MKINSTGSHWLRLNLHTTILLLLNFSLIFIETQYAILDAAILIVSSLMWYVQPSTIPGFIVFHHRAATHSGNCIKRSLELS